MRFDITCFAFAATICFSGVSSATDWVAAPSYYSHDPLSGERVQQYSPIGPFYIYPRGDFRRSGFRQTRSSIQVGGSSDHMHIVEEWGKPVRPYGEWRFPYRPYSVPYGLWGPPVPQVYAPRGIANQVGPPHAAQPYARQRFDRGPQAGQPDIPRLPFRREQPYPGYHPQPWDDGRYPPYDSDGPYGYPDLQRRPPIIQPPPAPPAT